MGSEKRKKVNIKRSKPHRRGGGWVRGYFRHKTKKASRNKPHKRNPRRTKAEITKKGTRMQEKRRRMKKRPVKIKETKQIKIK